MRRSVRLVLFALVPFGLAGCGTSEQGDLSSPASAPGDAGLLADADDGGVDVTAADVPQDAAEAAEAGAAQDIAEPDAATPDVPDAAEVTAQPDTAPAADTATAPIDAGPHDAGTSADTGSSQCADYASKFLATQSAARKCTSPFACTELAPAGMACHDCETYYTNEGTGAQPVWDISAEAKQKKCAAMCPTGGCVDPTVHVGICTAGQCGHDAPSCDELEKRAAAAIQQGTKCTADADCNFQAQTSLPCGCAAFLNGKTIGPAKPLMRYVQMLVKVYNAKKCFSGACACPQFNKAVCEAGICKSLP